MRKVWHEDAWEEYLNWQRQDAKTLRRINQLLQSIDRNGMDCIEELLKLRHIRHRRDRLHLAFQHFREVAVDDLRLDDADKRTFVRGA